LGFAVSYSPDLMVTSKPSLRLSLNDTRRPCPKCTPLKLNILHSVLMTRVDSEFSGHMRDGLLYLVKAYENDGQGIARDVEYLELAMSGMGTKDERLYVSPL
jgi:hypothetical protein